MLINTDGCCIGKYSQYSILTLDFRIRLHYFVDICLITKIICTFLFLKNVSQKHTINVKLSDLRTIQNL